MPDQGGFKGVVQRLGDALAGVDRQAAYRQGLMQRAKLDYTQSRDDEAQSRSEATLQLALKRRAERRHQAMVNDSNSRLGDSFQALDYAHPDAYANIARSGIDFSDLGQGRLYEQEYGHRATVANPALDLDTRRAAAQSVEPTDLSKLPLGNALTGSDLVLVQTPEGPQYANAPDAIGMPPAARPSAQSSDATTKQREVAALIDRGIPQDRAISIAYGEPNDPQSLFMSVYANAMRKWGTADMAKELATNAVEGVYGPSALGDTGTGGQGLPGGIPEGWSVQQVP